MRYEFETTGPLTLAAKMRASDLVVVADEAAPLVVVDVEPRRGGDDLAAATRVEMAGGRLEVAVPKSVGGLFGSRGSVVVTVTIPPGSSIDVETGSGDVRTQGALAWAEIKSGSGDLTLERAEEVRIASGSGDVSLGETGSATVTTGSGDIRIGRSAGRSELRAGSGDITVEGSGDLSVTTGSGDATIGAAAGRVQLGSGSGDLTVRTISHGEVSAKAASGDVLVGVARGTAALLDCSSISGRVSSDLEAGDEPSEGENGAVLRLRSVSGDIRVHRA
ncbi:DUF4097 family beta strand repeat-containing protein [Pseudactinotalea sp.]|uniref:DUF4097 family beta strand repeat-containing protein n=1 Tax=Pseudactinotalea sp. TaxID=1926260 RepID=UPI003B3A40C5